MGRKGGENEGGDGKRGRKIKHRLAIVCQEKSAAKAIHQTDKANADEPNSLFIPDKKCNQSDALPLKHFSPLHKNILRFAMDSQTLRENSKSIFYQASLYKKRQFCWSVWQAGKKQTHQKPHTPTSVIPIQANEVCNWHGATAQNKANKKLKPKKGLEWHLKWYNKIIDMAGVKEEPVVLIMVSKGE